AFTAGMTGMKMWIARGPRTAITPRQSPNNGPGMRDMRSCNGIRRVGKGARRSGLADLRVYNAHLGQARDGCAVPTDWWARFALPTLRLKRLFLQLVPRPEHPPHDGEADREEHQRHRQADRDADVGDSEEAPAEAADQVD